MQALLSVLNNYMMNNPYKLNRDLYSLYVLIIMTTVTVFICSRILDGLKVNIHLFILQFIFAYNGLTNQNNQLWLGGSKLHSKL